MEEKKKFFYGWWIVIGSILVTATVIPSVMAMAGKFQTSVTADLGINKGAFALSSTILQAMGIVLSPFVSKKLAKGNMKKIQCISIILFAAVFATYGLAQKAIHLYIPSVILGVLFLTTSMLPIPMMITNWFIEKRGLAMSLAMTGIGVGGFIFSPLITSWISNFGWRNTYFIFAAVILVVALPISIFIFAKTPEDKGLKPYGYGEENKKTSKNSKKQVKLSLETKEIFNKPFFIILIIGMICNGLINMGALGQFPAAIEEVHGPAIQATIVSLYSLIGIFGKLIIGWINDKFGLISAILFGGVSFGLSFVSMLFVENSTFIYLVALFLGLGMAIGNVLPPIITSEVFGQDKYGEVYGYVNSTTQIGLSLGSLLVASIFDVSGTYKIAWFVMISVSAVTIISWITSYKQSLKYRV